ncbi:MAG: ATP-binding protein [Planctomycetes bacterium]|nr:ATP-binding protein [Planctomycetota bacterium]
MLRTLDARMSCAIIAPAGTGKTSVLRAVVARLPEARYSTHYVKVTGLSKRDMCREIAYAAGVRRPALSRASCATSRAASSRMSTRLVCGPCSSSTRHTTSASRRSR